MWNRLPGITIPPEDQKIFWELGEMLFEANLSSREKQLASDEIREMLRQLTSQNEVSAQNFLENLLENL